MKVRLSRLSRPLVLTILTGSVLALSLGNTAWATPAQWGVSATIPTATSSPVSGGSDPDEDQPTSTPAPTTAPAGTAVPAPTTAPIVAVSPPTARGCTATVAPNGVVDSGTVGVTDRPLDSLPSRAPQYVYVGACEVTFTDAAGNIVPNYTFASPIEVCLPYTDADLARAGNNPASLVIIGYDPETGQPIELPYTIDPVNKKICGKLSRVGVVALAMRAAQAVSLPNTSGEIPNEVVGGAAAVAPLAPAAPAEAAAGAGPLQWPLVAVLAAMATLCALILALSRRMIVSKRDE